jgi:dihydrodipicolinate synthase/N-acetylneuraminate lyase
MPLSTDELLAQLDTVTSIPVIPFRDGAIDYDGHAKNIDYLMTNNTLEGGRRRIIGVAGTSLVHHIGLAEQARVMEATGRHMAGKGIFIAGVVPNPIVDAEAHIRAMSALEHAPDAYLIMPLTGVADPAGLYSYYLEFAERLGSQTGARFLYYLRQQREADIAVRLVNDSPYFVGIKIGTSEDDVAPIVNGVQQGSGVVMWGIGDRSTGAAQKGTKGHTSGINVVFAKASDAINNAQRRGDWETSRQVEAKLDALEDIRFRDSRTYNYSAVVEAMIIGGFPALSGGEGGPFNPRVPAAVASEVEKAIADLIAYH